MGLAHNSQMMKTRIEGQGAEPPQLLIGHTGLMQLLLKNVDEQDQPDYRKCLTQLDRLELRELINNQPQHAHLLQWLDRRGAPDSVISQLKGIFPDAAVLQQLTRLINHLSPLAEETGISLQLDPTFQPMYALYDGIVFQLVCRGTSSPVVVARGGRYDTVVQRLGARGKDATGLGFSFCVDDLRDLPGAFAMTTSRTDRILLCYSQNSSMEQALQAQASLHRRGLSCQVDHHPCETKAEAEERLREAGCNSLEWVGD